MNEYNDEVVNESENDFDNDDIEQACLIDEVENAQDEQARAREKAQKALDASGRHLAEKIAVNGGFGNAAVDAAIRDVVNGYLKKGQDLQGIVDAANRSFERNNQQYYLGVGEKNQIVLYGGNGGPRILKLK